MLNNALNITFFVETLHEIGFHAFILMMSTFPSTIWNRSSASYACTLVQYSVSAQFSPYPLNGYPDIKTTESTSNDGVEVVIIGNSY